MISSRSLRRTALAATAMTALTTATMTAARAADPVPTFNVVYDAYGSSRVAKTGSSVEIGPTTLTTYVNPDGTFTGNLPIPSRKTKFNAFGLLPIEATVNFIPAAEREVTGHLGRGAVFSTARYYIKLTNVNAFGIVPTFVGDSCTTVDPVVIPANTPEGEQFNIITGGHLSGSYTIGAFANCGLTTLLVNLLVPGPGNTVSLNLSNGRQAGS